MCREFDVPKWVEIFETEAGRDKGIIAVAVMPDIRAQQIEAVGKRFGKNGSLIGIKGMRADNPSRARGRDDSPPKECAKQLVEFHASAKSQGDDRQRVRSSFFELMPCNAKLGIHERCKFGAQETHLSFLRPTMEVFRAEEPYGFHAISKGSDREHNRCFLGCRDLRRYLLTPRLVLFRMRITIDARMMGAGAARGIGRYIEELIRAMLAIAPMHTYCLLERYPDSSPFLGHSSVEHVHADIPWYGFAEQIHLPVIIRTTKPDIVHIPHWNVPVFDAHPRVVTIHDLILLEEPDSASVTTRGPVVAALKRAGYHLALRNALTRSRRILVPSVFSRQWIERRFAVHAPITITGEGMPEPDESSWREPNLETPYILYVGSAYPHKNLDKLLDAWKLVEARQERVSLVIAGKRDDFMRRLETQSAKNGLCRVRFEGEVGEERLRNLYAEALAFVFPSRLEGFGLPPLEALAYGCPVLSSNAGSLPEVLGKDGIVFFKPGDPNAILEAIETVLRDPRGVRGNARQIVPVLSGRHDWRLAASRTLEAYEDAVR